LQRESLSESRAREKKKIINKFIIPRHLGTGVTPFKYHFWVKISERFKIYLIQATEKDGDLFFPKKSHKKTLFLAEKALPTMVFL
jgi:hypothetical protein